MLMLVVAAIASTESTGVVRLVGQSLDDFALDDAGAVEADRNWLASRFLLGGDTGFGPSARVALEVEALTGPLAGDFTATGSSRGADTFLTPRHDRTAAARVSVRKANIAWTDPHARIVAGADTFGFGLGTVANDGRGTRPFGQAWRGNAVARLGAQLTPWRAQDGTPVQGLGFLVAADVVLRDDNADIWLGDTAAQAVVGTRWQFARGAVGAFLSARHQRDRLDPADEREGRSSVFAVPVAAFASLPLLASDAPFDLFAEAEVAAVRGHTDRPYVDATREGGAQIASLGGIGRLRAEAGSLSLFVEGGYASGDNDPRDAVVSAFRFHSDHDVGMVLFEHVLPLLYAHSIDRLHDPGLVAAPPPGTRYLVPQGVENAIYLFPAASWTPMDPLSLRVATVLARGAGDVGDPYQTAVAGGYSTTVGGTTWGPRAYGTEVDIGATARWRRDDLVVSLHIDAGLLVPGAAFDGVVIDDVWTQRGTLEAAW